MKANYKQGALMRGWFKSPNAVIDDITGDVLSPQASVILTSIIRMTEGIKGREWAQIPHSFFMRKTQAKRRETIAKYLQELIDNELIVTEKSNGKTTKYSVNWRCKYWHEVEEVEVNDGQSVPVRFNRTSTLYPYIPVRLIRTGSLKTSTFHPYTYKDIIKDNNKDIYNATKKEKVKKEVKAKAKARKRKHDIPSEFTVTETQQKKCNEYGINSSDLVNEFDNHHSSKGTQFVDWSKAFSTWITNHIRFNKLQPTNQTQVNRNERHHTANNKPRRETQAEYEQRMQRGFNEEFGIEVQPHSDTSSYS